MQDLVEYTDAEVEEFVEIVDLDMSDRHKLIKAVHELRKVCSHVHHCQ